MSGRANTCGKNEKGLKLNETAAGSVYLSSDFSGPGRGVAALVGSVVASNLR